MRITRIVPAAVLLFGLTAGVAHAGGQASVHIVNAPKNVVTGRPFEVAFTVRPEWPMTRNRSLEPTVRAVCGDRVVTIAAVALRQPGRYKAAIALPVAGEWVITVDSRFCHTKMEPLVLTAAPRKRATS